MSGMDNPSFDVLSFLDEPGRPASIATVTDKGHPALATMWFSVGDDRLWFHTPDGGDHSSPFLRAAADNREVAVMIATFDPPDDVRQVRVTGPARLEARDDGRVRAPWPWPTPELKNSPTFRWSEPARLFELLNRTH